MDLTRQARSEKDSQVLLEIPENFYTVAYQDIMNQEQAVLQVSEVEATLLKDSIIADRRALKMISDLRIKKLVKAAVSDAYRVKPEHLLDHMLPNEKQFYDQTVAGIKNLLR
jgi:DNA replication initiation complex subunit (GINS family)